MNTLPALFLESEALDSELEAFCNNDPKYLQASQEFYEAAEEFSKHVSPDLYNTFEKRFNTYLFRTADLYYLYGLGLRQDILRAIGG